MTVHTHTVALGFARCHEPTVRPIRGVPQAQLLGGQARSDRHLEMQPAQSPVEAPARGLIREPAAAWGRLPLGMSFGGDANAVAVDSRDRVIVFNRGPVPVVVFDADG